MIATKISVKHCTNRTGTRSKFCVNLCDQETLSSNENLLSPQHTQEFTVKTDCFSWLASNSFLSRKKQVCMLQNVRALLLFFCM